MPRNLPTPLLLQDERTRSRRDFLLRCGAGFGALPLVALLNEGRPALADDALAPVMSSGVVPLAARSPMFAPRAKSVIFLFMDGGPSQLDTFDPKPQVNALAGQPLPPSIRRPITPMGVSNNALLASRRVFRQAGQSGIPVSDWLPHLATCADDLTVIRSCWADGLNHVGSVCQMNTGSILAGRPSLGSWTSYGLGTENQNLPAFVVLTDGDREPPGGARNWGTGFMAGTYQGTRFRRGAEPVLHLEPPASVTAAEQRQKLELLAEMNRRHAHYRDNDPELEARIASYELAYRMQSAAPEAVDLQAETATTLSLYGLDDQATEAMGRSCLLAPGWSSAASASCRCIADRAAAGTPTPRSKKTTARYARLATSRSPDCSRISSSAGYWTRRS